MNREAFLGIDLGTSSCKVAIFDAKGNLISSSSKSYPLYLTEGGGAEQSPDQWWDAIVSASKEAIEKAEDAIIKGIGVTGQWSGTVAVDEKGRPLHNAIIWLDSRGRHYIKELIKGKINVFGYGIFKLYKWIRRTGGAPSRSGKDSLAHILYIKNEMRDLYENTYKFLEPISYINFKLTRRFVSSYDIMVTHWITDNRDINNIRYDDSLIKIAGIDKGKLPELASPIQIIGRIEEDVKDELGLKERAYVIAGGGDIQTSLIGAGCIFEHQVLAYVGTSAWLTAHINKKKTDPFHNIASLPSALPGKYFIAAEQECAGRCLDFLCSFLSIDINKIDEIASKSETGSKGLIFTPWLYGERAPIEDSLVRGTLFNISLDNDKSDMIHAALEGIAFNLRWLLSPVQAMMGRRINRIKLAGGCARSKLLAKILADVLECKLEVVENPSLVNARAAALMAALAKGYTNLANIAISARISQVYNPDKNNTEKYRKIFKCFIEIYKRNKKIFKILNG